MKRYRLVLAITVGFLVPPSYALAQCQVGMVQSGSTCIDTFEASLWKITDAAASGSSSRARVASGVCRATPSQVGINGVDYTDAQCLFNGGGCKNIFALSMPGVIPARSINYFIAAAACRNSGKRLPSNAEWQAAALGTPDPWPQDDPAHQCNSSGPTALTGSRSKCVSDVGAFDMVGNVIEFVADWGALATTGTNWDVFIPGFGGDVSNIGGSRTAPSTGSPARPCAAAASRPAAAGPASWRACTRSTRTAPPTASAMRRPRGSGARSNCIACNVVRRSHMSRFITIALVLFSSAVTSAAWATPISDKYAQLGGAGGFLGQPTIAETSTPDGVGRYRHYEHGSIYWHPRTGAHKVHGLIGQRWAELNWEQGYLGYPITDEIDTVDGAVASRGSRAASSSGTRRPTRSAR